jgi:DNA-binding HxlR family transcriptional regulator
MAGKRSYGDRCGIARALEVVGERWALLVVRELLLGPKRFGDLRHGLPKIGPDVLSQRLRDLEQAGVIAHGQLPPPISAKVYELTARGRELEPVLLALGRWGSEVAFPADASAFSPDSMVLALKTLFSARAAATEDVFDSAYELRLDDQPFVLRPTAALLEVRRGEVPQPAAIIAAAPATLARVLWHGASLEDELRAGEIRIDGDRASAERLFELFPASGS